jgi:hypothetical protein
MQLVQLPTFGTVSTPAANQAKNIYLELILCLCAMSVDIVPASTAIEPGMLARLVLRLIPQEDKQMRLCRWREFGELHRDA